MKILRWTSMVVLFGAVAIVQAAALDDVTAGVKAMQRGDNDEAIRLYTKALASGELPPADQALLTTMRGNLWFGKKDNDRAIADYDQAIKLNPNMAETYNNRANAWYNKKDYDRAIADFNEAIRLKPVYPDAFRNRGDSWQHKKDYGRAIADYNETIRLSPKDANAFNNRGGAKERNGDAKGAEADYARARELGYR